MMKDVMASFQRLREYCERERWKGWDPYDGLNSRILQTVLPLRHSALLRLCVIQGFKRCPVNLRPLLGVPKQHNAKGIGLFLQGYCNLYRAVTEQPELAATLGSAEELRTLVTETADLLLSLRSQGKYHGACWGYNFDWQARRLFLFPAHTPTVVATNFCATALMEAYEVTQRQEYLDVALTAADFVMNDLHRHDCGTGCGFLFSYSPLPGNDTVYNASLLGSRLLSYCYRYTGREEYRKAARESVQACAKAQAPDGSWVYGMLPVQSWIDSFHTGYNLDGLIAYEELTGDKSFHDTIERGFDFYIKHFFEADGCPKYYHDRKYPIDIHCPGQLFVTLHRLHRFGTNKELAGKVLDWTLRNMQDRRGYFYYQLKPGKSSKISYMRWSNAFMFNALSYYILSVCEKTKE